MTTILVSGATGAGKSTLIRALSRQRKLTLQVVDPLMETASASAQWQPSTEDVDAVVFDHISDLEDASTQIERSAVWSREHRARLVLVTQDVCELEHIGISKKPDILVEVTRISEMTMTDCRVTLWAPQGCVSGTLSAGRLPTQGLLWKELLTSLAGGAGSMR